ncbi:MAG: ATP-binding cassette domain-containing protein [Kiloniellales bacterium]
MTVAATQPDVEGRDALAVVTAASIELGGRPVLEEIDLAVEAACLTAVIGPSGCGKTTLLRLLGGLIEPTKGRVESHRERTAFVFQDHRLLPWRTALENVALGALSTTAGRLERHRMAERLFSECGLSAEAYRLYPAELSGGMRARVALARALAAAPQLLLLDEPFNGLDLQMRRSLQTMLRALVERRGLGAVLVTHDLLEAAGIADQIVAIAPSGRIAYRESFDRPPADRDGDTIQATAQRLMQRLDLTISGRT